MVIYTEGSISKYIVCELPIYKLVVHACICTTVTSVNNLTFHTLYSIRSILNFMFQCVMDNLIFFNSYRAKSVFKK